MEVFESFLNKIEDTEHRTKIKDILQWVQGSFPELEMAIKWNQPMFMDHGTFIIAFSVAKGHFAIAPEYKCMEIFRDKAKALGYGVTKMLIQFKWHQPMDYEFLKEIIQFNIEDKQACQSFWREKDV